MTALGHKNIKNTLIYTHLVKFAEKDEYISKVVHSVEATDAERNSRKSKPKKYKFMLKRW